jgi:hypothetical protein
MGQPTSFDVDAGLLEAIAGRAADAGVTTGAAYTTNQGGLVPTGAVSGWSTTQSTVLAAAAWGPFVQGLAVAVAGLGSDLKAAAAGYAQADADAAGRHRRFGAQYE